MKKIIVFLIIYSFNLFGYSQNLDLYKKTKGFSDELHSFIKMNNKRNVALSEYFVYVVYVYPIINKNDGAEGIGYTIGFVFNHDALNYINPQYYFTDSTDIIAVTFNPKLKNKCIKGLNLIKLEDKSIIKNKLMPENEGYVTGTFEGLIYNDYPQQKEKVFYENSDLIPRENSIFRYFPPVEIRQIKKGNEKDSLYEKSKH